MIPAEIRYLNITWESPNEALKVEACHDALEIEKTETGWQAETCTFPRLYHSIGIRITASGTLHPPYFRLNNGKREELLPVKVPGTGEVWWIQNSGWDKKNKRYLSELYRTAGRVDLVVQEQQLTLNNNTFNFTVEELEHYLADFKNNLWMLILDSNSVAKATVPREVPNYLDPEVLKLFHDFAQQVTDITKKPGMVLSEIQGSRALRSVRPVPRTFREYAVKPHAKELTSRAYIESYDTAENRYIHYCVDRVRYLLKALKNTANAQTKICSQRIIQEKQWLDNNREMHRRQVDPRTFDNEIIKLHQDLDKLNERFQVLVADSHKLNSQYEYSEFGSYTFKLSGNYGNRDASFFGEEFNGINFKQRYNTYLVVTFPEISDLGTKEFKRCGEISVTGRYIWPKRKNAKGQDYYEVEFIQVTGVSIIQHPYMNEIQRLEGKRKLLAGNDWFIDLSAEERKERETERKVSTKKIDFLQHLQKQSAEFFHKIPSLYQPLARASTFFKTHKVQKRSNCPNSMIFVQNPSYAATKSLFRKISTLNGMDESIFNALMTIDNMGLVNVSNLYEKWCLLQIIKVLNQTYGFDMSTGWQKLLVTAVLQKSYDIEIQFEAAERQQRIVLTYEKVLASGKRPDFVIDLISKNYLLGDTGQWTWNQEKTYRMVMDAKFRGKMSEAYLQKMVTELYHKKDYSEGKQNSFYILHPSPETIADRTSPLDWGTDCDYGQTNNHRHGAIFVSPSLAYTGTLQHVQRLIGLFLQANASILQSRQNRSDPADWHNISCISCGNSEHRKLAVAYDPTKAGSNRWIIKCHSCSLLTVKTICYSCGADLYKNGPRWTYHRTRAEQLSNVVCPSCEEFL